MEKEDLLMNEGVNSTPPTWSSCNFSSEQVITNCCLNPNWDYSMDQSDPFEAALSSIVSSPAASNAPTTCSVIIPAGGGGDNVMIRELIGRLGSICNSGEVLPQSYIQAQNNNNSNTCCYSTPLNSPPLPKLNLSMIRGSKSSNNLPIPAADPGFAERAARLSCFAGSQMNMNSSVSASDSKKLRVSRSSTPESNNNADSKEGSSLSEQITSQTVTDSNPRKRKSIQRPKAKETPPTNDPKVVAENPEDSNSMRSKQDENKSDSSKTKDNSKPVEPPKDYIHVRARRGQATDSHSLAERVRREKISERMKFLQDLVPGCNKVTGKAVMLDEIINYVQSLQRQVEFLSMKLATVNPRMDLNMEALLSKDLFQSCGYVQHSLYPGDCSVQTFPSRYQPQQGSHLTSSGITNNAENQFSINALNSALHRNHNIQLPPINGHGEVVPRVPSLWDDDLQSLVQMGFNQNQPRSLNGSMATTQMKIEM